MSRKQHGGGKRSAFSRTRPVAIEQLESRHLMATVAVFANSRFVDTQTSVEGEVENVKASLTSLGHTVAPFTGIDLAGTTAGLTNATAVVIPDLEVSYLSSSLDTDVRQAYRDFVSDGGVLIMNGNYYARDVQFLNDIFGWTIQDTGGIDDGGRYAAYPKSAAAVGTAFESGPATLGSLNGTYNVITTTLPAGAISLYGNTSGYTALAQIPYGRGNVVFTAFDWYNAKPRGNQDGNWNQVLDIAVKLGANDVAIDPIVPNLRNSPVSSVAVTFATAIDPTSFTLADVKLTRDGVDVPLASPVAITLDSGNRYLITGLDSLNATNGAYRLAIDSTAINDSTGNPFRGSATVIWTLDNTSPTLDDVVDVVPKLRLNANKAVNAIDVVFSEPIDLTTFDLSDITLTRSGATIPLASPATIQAIPATPGRYKISGLTSFTNVGGDYTFTVNGSGIKDLAGNTVSGTASDSWVANDAPVVSLGGRINYLENGAPKAIAGFSVVSDVDTPEFVGGKLVVTITQNGRASDHLSIPNRGNGTGQIGVVGNVVSFEGTRFGTFTGGTAGTPLVITLEAGSTPVAVQSLINVIAFDSPGQYLNPIVKRVQYVLDDGEGGTSRPVIKEIAVSPVNDAPTITLGANPKYVRNANPIKLAPAAVVNDVDNPTFNGGSLAVQIVSGSEKTEQLGIGGRFVRSGDDISLDGKLIGTIHPNRRGINGNLLFIRFNVNATSAAVQELVRSITYRTLSSKTTDSRTIEFTVWDGALKASDRVSVTL